MIRASVVVAALLFSVPAYAVPCWAVRKAVAQYGETAVEAWARARGIPDKEIEKARRCLRQVYAPETTIHAQAALVLNQLLKQSPSDFDNHIYVERAFQQLNAGDPTVAARMNVRRIQELILAIEQTGARLFLFELRYSTQIEGARGAKTTREIVHAEFPDPDR
jgi:hypothetical protein